MSGIVALLLLIPLLVALAAVGLLRANVLSRLVRPRAPAPPAEAGPATGTTQIRAAPSLRERSGQIATSSGLRIGVVAATAAVIFGVVISRVMAPPALDDFVVLVAPFQDDGGGVTRTGQSAAERLVAALPQATGGRVQAALLDAPPADAEAAARLLEARGADALVWGTIAPGGMLDAETLTPQLAYRPSGPYAPNAWAGYTGRFALPSSYRISARPINGAAVLPQLLGALADYGAGRPDQALAALSALQDGYPALDPVLPSMLVGNLRWASGAMPAAADAYRRALGAADGRTAAALASNLGAILEDSGDIGSRDALNMAIGLLNASGGDLGELRYNIARSAAAAGDTRGEVESLEQARRQLPASAPLLLDMTAAYRAAGRLADPGDGNGQDDEAQSVLSRVERQIVRDTDAAPADLRQLETSRLRGRFTLETALLRLTQLVELHGPLLWGLEARTDLDRGALARLAGDLDSAVDAQRSRSRGWGTRAAAEDAAGHPLAGQIALQQARLADADLREAQRWRAAVALELGESEAAQPPQGFAALWSGLTSDSAPLAQAKRSLEELVAASPRDADLLIMLGHDLVARGELGDAAARFNQAAALAPGRPEPPYGLALARLADQKADPAQRRAAARELLLTAVARDAAFYPARIQLAALAEADGDWAGALDQRRRLAAEQPSDSTALDLARALHRTGREHFAEAEQLLLPLGNRNSIPALLELASLYGEYGDPKAQRGVLERAQRAAPRNIDVAYALGQLSLSQGDRSEAARQFQIALAADSVHIPSLLAMGGLSADRPDQAAQYYRRALDAGANDVPTLKQIGLTMLANGQDDLALAAFERAAKVSPDDADTQRGMAAADLRLGRLEAAETAARRAADLRGGADSEALAILGDVALQRGRADDARDRFAAAVQASPAPSDAAPLSPLRARAEIGLGRAYGARGEWAVAAGHFRAAAAADTQSPEALLWLGEALIRQGDAAGALAQYQAASALRPSYPEALFGAAQAQLALGQTDQAQANLDSALRLRPRYPEAKLLQGKLYEQIGNTRKAMEAYSAAIDQDPALPEPHFRRALLLIQDDKLDEARRELDAALQLRASFPEATFWLGRVDFAQGRAADARARFQKAAAQAGGTYPEARYYEGLSEEQLGLRDAAIESFRAALDQGGGSLAGEARAALARLGAQ